MLIPLDKFLEGIEKIYRSQPEYVKGRDGSDGKCDCIGLIKGALRRAGVEPKNLSGTNYAARYGGLNLKPITLASRLKVGDVVLKAKSPGDSGYNLLDSYKPGGKNYNGDLTDYSHIGVVTSVNPLVITHMTSPAAKKDTEIGNWKYYGQLPQVDYKDSSGGGGGMVEVSYKAKVIGGALNMRKAPSTSADRITQIPDGSIVDVTAEDNEWCAITYNGKSGYGMRKYLEEEKETGDRVTVSRAELEKIYDTIGDWLGFRG